MGDHNKSAPKPLQPLLQPGGHGGVQVVGGLVQYQHIRRMDQRRRQCHALALTAGERTHLLLIVGDTQLVEHGLGLVFVYLAEFRRQMQKHLLQHGGCVLHNRVLGPVCLRKTCQDLQKGGFSRSVHADDAGSVSFI